MKYVFERPAHMTCDSCRNSDPLSDVAQPLCQFVTHPANQRFARRCRSDIQ